MLCVICGHLISWIMCAVCDMWTLGGCTRTRRVVWILEKQAEHACMRAWLRSVGAFY